MPLSIELRGLDVSNFIPLRIPNHPKTAASPRHGGLHGQGLALRPKREQASH